MILFRLIPVVFRPARLRGSIHQYGEQLHLLASLEAYGRDRRKKRTNYVWEVSQKLDSPDRLPEAVDELAYRIFIDLSQEDVFKSWRAFKAYTDGLSSYISYVDLKWDTDYETAEACYKEGLEKEPQSAALKYSLGVLQYGCVANRREIGAREGRRSPQGQHLCGDAEDGVDELTLTDRIALSDPADLAFSNCMHRLVALDRSTCALR
jgi:hypothetical protein